MDGDTFLESLDQQEDPGSLLQGEPPARCGRGLDRHGPERWEELLRLDQRDRWSRGQSSEEVWRDSGTRGRPFFFFFSSSPMWKRHSVKRKTGGDRTQRQHEGRVSYPPPDLKGKQNP